MLDHGNCSEASRVSRGAGRRAPRFRVVDAAVVAAILCCCSVSSAASPWFGRGEVSRAAAESAWWRKRFPPSAIQTAIALAPVRFDPSRVMPEPACGSVDIAKLDGPGVFLAGWAYDPLRGTPARAVILLDNGRQIDPVVRVFRDRPDVALAKGNRRLIASGWAVWLPPGRVAPGKHAFEAFAVLADGRFGRLGGRQIEGPVASDH